MLCEDNFDPEVGTDYEIFLDQPNPFDTGIVDVPRISVTLSPQQIQILQATYDPLSPSDSNGLDMYVDVCRLVNSWQT